jgi:general secretion pathway protein K
MSQPGALGGHRQHRGAALLTAMIIVALVATLAGSMVWQQWRAIQVEAAERARTQSAWILSGALDWARLILREDGKNGVVDHLGEPWAVPLAEARLSTFLAADKDNPMRSCPASSPTRRRATTSPIS